MSEDFGSKLFRMDCMEFFELYGFIKVRVYTLSPCVITGNMSNMDYSKR